MSLRSLRALPLLLAGLGVVCAEERGPGAALAVPGPRPLRRRYSEAALASDYSRSVERVLGRNFVQWLLARRERDRPEAEEPLERETRTPKGAGDGGKSDFGAPGAKDFLGWLWKNRENPSFPALEGSEGLREFLEQEFLTWLMSGELCRAQAA
ncbi:gastric inhibitory polypeptide-like [Vidua chalybeata]|uniref:gastric inhibitory polypeptide-like n=1 Tax=Vidua chalybeata TaxID=81927 RepID=UPI0023A8BBC9|nr:gastric inhibitory polypeptide-like [Vidua chalybeata]